MVQEVDGGQVDRDLGLLGGDEFGEGLDDFVRDALRHSAPTPRSGLDDGLLVLPRRTFVRPEVCQEFICHQAVVQVILDAVRRVEEPGERVRKDLPKSVAQVAPAVLSFSLV